MQEKSIMGAVYVLEQPFQLSCENSLGWGSIATVSWINEQIVIEYPIRFEDVPRPLDEKALAESKESIRIVEREKKICDRLAAGGFQPNIL